MPPLKTIAVLLAVCLALIGLFSGGMLTGAVIFSQESIKLGGYLSLLLIAIGVYLGYKQTA